MREAGVNLVSVGIFSWALLEPRRGRTTSAGSTACSTCCTPTASRRPRPPRPPPRPPGSLRATPRSRPVTRDGLGSAAAPGDRLPELARVRGRRAASPSALARRYAGHPAVVMWHVHNEYGAHVPACYCDRCAVAFRAGCGQRYGDLAALNDAWGTAFWGQRYGDWDEIDRPARADRGQPGPAAGLPAVQLDALLELPRASATSCAGSPRACRSPRTSWPPPASRSTTGPGRPRSTSSPTTTTCGPRRRQPHRPGDGRRPQPGRWPAARRGC